MKAYLFFLYILLTSIYSLSQNQLKAKVEYEEAESFFSEKKYDDALLHLNKAENFIENWVPNISYLKIQILDKICDYNDLSNSNTKQLIPETKKYIKYMAENQNAVVEEKFKIVYAIEQKIDNLSLKGEWLEMPYFLIASEAYEKNDPLKALEWFKKASDKGNGYADYMVGIIYHLGKGVNINYETAIKYYSKAMANNIPDAYNNMGALYVDGNGVNKNITEAIVLYKKATEMGSVPAMNNLGDAYKNGIGVSKNSQEAIKWYTMACEKGNAESCYEIGLYFHNGNEIKQSYSEARIWYDKALKISPNVGAINNIAWMYYNGQGGTININEAVKWYEKGVSLDNSWSMYNLGKIYKEYNFGGKTTTDIAVNYLKRAADKGEEDAMKLLIEIYRFGVGNVKRDRQLEKEWTNKLSLSQNK